MKTKKIGALERETPACHLTLLRGLGFIEKVYFPDFSEGSQFLLGKPRFQTHRPPEEFPYASRTQKGEAAILVVAIYRGTPL